MASWWLSLRQWREQRTLRERPIPDALWAQTLAHYPFLAALDANDREALRKLATLFLAEKEFTGAGGLVVTDEMAVAVAAQACLPVLKLGLHWYEGFVGIVIHPDEVVARREVVDEHGIVHAYDEELAGEAMEGGPVTLTWRSVAEGGETAAEGFNVVIHEFAHVMDMRGGSTDGMPPLPRHIDPTHWTRVMEAAYAHLTRRLDADQPTVIDPYGESSPAEFFAVACEAFFVAGAALREDEPYLYDLLQAFFQQDPAARSG